MSKITINRAPVLSLWAFVVARRLGYSHDTALTLAKAIAGMSAYAKAKSLGLVEERETGTDKRKTSREASTKFIVFMGRRIPVAASRTGQLALAGGKPIQPVSVKRYLDAKFGENYDDVSGAMTKLARSRSPAELAGEAFHLYEKFRPSIPAGVSGWGKAGVLDLKKIERLAGQKTG